MHNHEPPAPATGAAQIVITHVEIYPPTGKPIVVPIEHFRGNGPGLVTVADPDVEGGSINYYGFPYRLRFRPSAVLAPGGPRILVGS